MGELKCLRTIAAPEAAHYVHAPSLQLGTNENQKEKREFPTYLRASQKLSPSGAALTTTIIHGLRWCQVMMTMRFVAGVEGSWRQSRADWVMGWAQPQLPEDGAAVAPRVSTGKNTVQSIYILSLAARYTPTRQCERYQASATSCPHHPCTMDPQRPPVDLAQRKVTKPQSPGARLGGTDSGFDAMMSKLQQRPEEPGIEFASRPLIIRLHSAKPQGLCQVGSVGLVRILFWASPGGPEQTTKRPTHPFVGGADRAKCRPTTATVSRLGEGMEG